MKKLLLITALLLSLLTIKAQTIYVSHQPVDFGLGVRGDYHINGMGLYSSVSYGNWGIYKEYDIKHHVKLTTGVLVPLPEYNGGTFDITAGLNYHLLQSSEHPSLNPKIFTPWSFELGLTSKLGRFAIGVRTDVLRWEPCVDVGFNFGR